MLNKITILVFLSLTCISCKNQNSTENNTSLNSHNIEEKNICCAGSMSQIIWEMKEIEAEEFLKGILNENKIEFKELSSQIWDSKNSTIGGIRDYKLSKLAPAGPNKNSLLLHLNSSIANKLAIAISKKINSPVIMILEHERGSWGYCLYKQGKVLNTFCSNPELEGLKPNECSADIKILTENYRVNKDSILPYLINTSNIDNQVKAFSVDEFTLTNPWVRVDFMKKLGISYSDSGKWIYIIDEGIND